MSQSFEAFPHSETNTVLNEQKMKSSMQIKLGSCNLKVVNSFSNFGVCHEVVGAEAAFLES